MSSMSMGADLDLAGFFLLNLRPEPVASLPAASTDNDGRVVMLSSDGRFYIGYQGGWQPMGMNTKALEGITPAQLRDRSTHTGTQPASTISDLKTVVTGYSISDFANATGDVGLGNNKISALADGTASSDAVNKSQLEAVADIANSAAAGIAVKQAVRVVSTSNITLSGTQTVDTVNLASGDRILVAGQSTASANGIYVVASGAWSRATDADDDGELAPGTLIAVSDGSANGDTLWGLVSDEDVTIGTTEQQWNKILSSTGEIVQGGDGITKTGVILSIDLAPNSGLSLGGSGLSVDESKVGTKYVGPVPAGSSPVTVTHNLGTEDVAVTVRDTSTGQQVLVPWNSKGTPNSVQLEFGASSISSGDYRVRIDG